MKRLLALYYIAMVLVVGAAFVSTLWTKTLDVQQSSTRTGLQQEVIALEKKHQSLDRHLSTVQSLTATTSPVGFEPITATVAVAPASSHLAAR